MTITRVPTRETPFRLTFGTEAVISVEVGLTSYQVKTYEDQKNQQELNSNLDLIDEVKEEAIKRMEKHKEAMARYYNRKVKVRRLHMRPHPQEGVTGNKGPIPRKTRTSPGMPLRGNLSFQRRLLLLEVSRRPGTASTMEHRTLEKILPVRNALHFKLLNLHISMYDNHHFRHS